MAMTRAKRSGGRVWADRARVVPMGMRIIEACWVSNSCPVGMGVMREEPEARGCLAQFDDISRSTRHRFG